jgi:hypothetical protein
MKRRAVIGLLLLLGPLAAVQAADDEEVAFELLVIRATTANEKIAPELKEIAQQLKTQFKYTGYALVKKEAQRVKLEKVAEIELPNPYTLRLTAVKADEQRVQFKVEILEQRDGKSETKLRTVLAARRGKAALLGGLPIGDQRDVLVLALTAR